MAISPLGSPIETTSSIQPLGTPVPAQTPAPESGGLHLSPWMPSTGQEGAPAAAGHTAANLIPSAINTGIGIVKMPFDLLKAAKQIPGHLAEEASQTGVLPTAYNAFTHEFPSALFETLVPEAGKQLLKGTAGEIVKHTGLDTAMGKKDVGQHMIDQSLEAASKAIQEDPVGQVLPFLIAARGAVYKASPEAGATFDKIISKTSETVTKPITGTAKVAGNLSRGGVAGLTGADAATVRNIIENPSAYSKKTQAGYTAPALADEIKAAIDAHQKSFEETGKQYGPIRANTTPIPVKPNMLLKIIADATGLSVDAKGKLKINADTSLTPSDVSTLQRRIVNKYQPAFTSGQITPAQFLNLRTDLGDIAHYEGGIGRSKPLEDLSDIMRGRLNSNVRGKISGLKEIDDVFGPQAKEAKAFTKGLLDRDGNLTDVGIRSISNATNPGHTVHLARLEKISPGITKKIQIHTAMKDLEHMTEHHKVATYQKIGGVTVGALGLTTGNIPLVAVAIAEMILTHPSVAVPLMRVYGNSKILAKAVLKALNSAPATQGKSLGGLAPQKALNAGKRYFEKNPPSLGLSMRDVSKDAYAGEKDLTLKTLEDLKGRSTVSKQYIMDATNRPDIRQSERDVVREALKEFGDSVPVKDFAAKVKMELLPLKRKPVVDTKDADSSSFRYEGITLPEAERGPISDYNEHIYESPIKTSAANTHFHGDSEKYFAHTRTEDLPVGEVKQTGTDIGGNPIYDMPSQADGRGGVRRVIELQSDLFQKGNLEKERFGGNSDTTYADEEQAIDDFVKFVAKKQGISKAKAQELFDDGEVDLDTDNPMGAQFMAEGTKARDAELAKVAPYRNTWHERVIKEELKQAAKDGKSAVQFPTGETAMRIEGLDSQDRANWSIDSMDPAWNPQNGFLTPEKLKVGTTITNHANQNWVITDVLGDGKFKAIPKRTFDTVYVGIQDPVARAQKLSRENYRARETFDISGKADTSNPIYKFYEKEVGKYLAKYGAKKITDARGVSWWEVPVEKDLAKLPITAYGKTTVGTAAAGAAATAGGIIAAKSLGALAPKKNDQ